MSGIELIVGLGNPDAKYRMTRHNAGFWFIDDLVEKLGASMKLETKFKGIVGEAVVTRKLRLLKPLTYMNHSGQSVAALANFFKIPAENILIVYDDLDFEPGQVRLKKGGSAGRHNGVQSAIDCLGQKGFWRLRVGIGHPGDRAKVIGYVLGKPCEADREKITESLQVALTCVDDLLEGDFQKVMNRLHVKI